MKKHKNLFNQVISLDNLYNAYRKSRKGRNNRKEILDFTLNLEEELLLLQKELVEGKYSIGEYRNFIIYEPKKRVISALPFRDRVVQHAICNIIEPLFDKRFVYDSYACRKGKGTHAGIKRLNKFMNKNKATYVLKCDIKKYFPSVNNDILKKLIRKKISDKKLLDLIDEIINSHGRGIPIGNLTSQLFANIYLNELDYFIKHDLRLKQYIRYMDDFIVLHSDKKYLHRIKEEIICFLKGFDLELHNKKVNIYPVKNGIDFLGYLNHCFYRKVRKSTVKNSLKNLKRKFKEYEQGKKGFYKIEQSINSWEAYLNHANTFSLKKDLRREVFCFLF
ncbi:MAG: reverse transcriptase/maturase family protein [Candidatus Woesearchaeota archaeon]